MHLELQSANRLFTKLSQRSSISIMGDIWMKNKAVGTASDAMSKSVGELQKLLFGGLTCILLLIGMKFIPGNLLSEQMSIGVYLILALFALGNVLLAAARIKSLKATAKLTLNESLHGVENLHQTATENGPADKKHPNTIIGETDHGSSGEGELSFTDSLTKLGNKIVCWTSLRNWLIGLPTIRICSWNIGPGRDEANQRPVRIFRRR